MASKSALRWTVPLKDGKHTVVFEHGTASGRRVIYLDDNEIYRKNWMFKLVGYETFSIGKGADIHQARISIEASGLKYLYRLTVDGKDLEQFSEASKQSTLLWRTAVNGTEHAVALDVEAMEIYVDGDRVHAQGEFVDDGTETHFTVGGQSAFVHTTSTGTRAGKMEHTLYVNEEAIGSEDVKSRTSAVGWKSN
eukprot:m.140822 g.140822  ORF g.140822 m.140822 type:complete len:194 (+) comp16115_c0_seq11:2630-3211(+)